MFKHGVARGSQPDRAVGSYERRERVWSVRRQVGRVIVAVVAAGAVASGCGGPSQAGSAAIVGSDAVPLEVIQSQLDTALAKPDQLAQIGIQPADVARALVSQHVLHDL